jgi:Transposase.
MPAFTNIEYRDMLFIYGFANGNSRAAVREYALRFPNRQQPSRNTFAEVFRRCGETGSFRGLRIREGGQNAERWRHAPAILQAVREDPTTSTRRIGAALRIHHSTVHRVLKRSNLHPYHLSKVQNLLPVDAEVRLQFCRWYLNHLHEWGSDQIIWTDEAMFTKCGIINLHNSHVWSSENPHATIVTHFQHEIRVNVWLGLRRGQLYGPVILPNRLNSNEFVNLLDNDLIDILEEMPIATRQNIYFQMDGCPAHNGRIVQNWMNDRFGEKWIGRYGPVRWPARSPDITPLDFYVWGTLKSNVYKIPINSREDLINRIRMCCNEMRRKRIELQRVVDSVRRRCVMCIENRGGHFEHSL